MEYKAAVCDDNEIDREYAATLLKKWARLYTHTVSIASFSSAEAFLFQYADNKEYDILLLDIEMGKMDGVSLAREIRRQNEAVQIVFITGFPDFIAEGYEVSALHYLMKPITEEKLFGVLDKAASLLEKKEKPIIISTDGESFVILQRDIIYIESQGHYIFIKTPSREYTVKMSLNEIETELSPDFVRCHRSFIVGLPHIKSIGKEQVLLDNGESVMMSRRLYDKTNQAFIKYYKEGF